MDTSLAAFAAIAFVLTITPGADMALVLRNTLLRGRAAAILTTLGICAACSVHAMASSAGLPVILAQSATAYSIVKLVGAIYLIYLGVMTVRHAGHAAAGAEAAHNANAGSVGRDLTRGYPSNAMTAPAAPFDPNPTGEAPADRPPRGYSNILKNIRIAPQHAAPTGAGEYTPGALRRSIPDGGQRLGRSFVEGALTNLLNPKVALFYLMVLPQFIPAGTPVLGRSMLLASIHIGMGLVWLAAYIVFINQLRGILTAPRVRAWVERVTGGVLIALGLRLAIERRP
jgi:threonine/homoserine/homoserine lactone efflux protein